MRDRAVALLGLMLAALPVWAGNIHFGLARSGDRLLVTNNGDSTAFYPQLLRLGADGNWLPLPPLQTGGAALGPGAQSAWQWREAGRGEAGKLAEGAIPVMVRFFDQAGTGFGQLSFFNQPMIGGDRIQARYRHGKLTLTAPSADEPGWRRSWLVWGQEDDIAVLGGIREFSHAQPAVRRIDWASAPSPVVFDLGGAQPPAWLVHETANGLEMQVISRGGRPGREQRAAWLDAGALIYGVAGLAGILSLLLRLVCRARVGSRR